MKLVKVKRLIKFMKYRVGAWLDQILKEDKEPSIFGVWFISVVDLFLVGLIIGIFLCVHPLWK